MAAIDGFVMAAWGRDRKAMGKIRFLGDGSAAWSEAPGLELEVTARGMGMRINPVFDGGGRRCAQAALNSLRTIAACTAAASLGTAAIAQSIPDFGFTTRVSAPLSAHYARKFGPLTPDRHARWIGFAREQKAPPFIRRLGAAGAREADVLQVFSDAINRQVEFLDDMAHWGVEDYGATPAGPIGGAVGDCESYSIAEYYLLKEPGVPRERLAVETSI